MNVCASCFNDIELKSFIETHSKDKGRCDFCYDNDVEVVDLYELRDFFSEFFYLFIDDPDGEIFIDLIARDWNLFSHKSDGKVLLSEVLLLLACANYDPEKKVKYMPEIVESISYWEKLKLDLKWNRRFLTDISEIFDLGWDSYFNEQIVLPNETELYRARIHKNAGDIAFKVDEMGSPLKEKAASGRANPLGIPYLYLCKSIDTTFYEIRATFLDEISIGKFVIMFDHEIVLVDFTEEVSAFKNMGTLMEYAKSRLLKKYISYDLSKPLRRYDSELEYIPTQFICEFIRYITGTDGIIFNSSLHQGGKNIVLFEQEKVVCVSVEKHQVTNVHIGFKASE